MFGTNPRRKPELHDGTSLKVQDIFATIQGEGPLVGMPAIFLRLGGCNLACRFCDTEFETFRLIPLDEIIAKIRALSKIIKLIVITGGEPMRQPIELLSKKLLSLNYQIQIETNGTLYRDLGENVCIICSPKAGKTGYHQLRVDLLSRCHSMKFLISESLEYYGSVPELGQTEYKIPVFIQPMDQYDKTLNKQNQELAVSLAIKYGYRLSIQTHKILDIR